MVSDSVDREGNKRNLYRDGKGFMTCGVGNKVNSARECLDLGGFYSSVTRELATYEELMAEWKRVSMLPSGMRAEAYMIPTSPLLTEDFGIAQCRRDMIGEFLPSLLRIIPGAMGFPVPAIRALAGMEYALGPGGLAGYTRLCRALRATPPNFVMAALECHILTARKETNGHHASWFREAATLAKSGA